MTDQQQFHIGDILSVMTGRLVSPTGVDGLRRFADYLAGEPLMTHQLARLITEAQPVLAEQHPDLVTVTIPEDIMGETKVLAWLHGVVQIHGYRRPVTPLTPDQHASIDPLQELINMRRS